MATALFFVLQLSLFSTHALQFQKACDPGDTLTIGAVGDVLLHGPLQKQGFEKGFRSLWSDVEPWMQSTDVFYANLEGPAASAIKPGGKEAEKDPGYFNGFIYSGYPQFNYPSFVIGELKDSGVDILSTANNHALDRREKGLRVTLSACDKYGMPCVGTRDDNTKDFYVITQQKRWSIAWVACTFSTNGISDREDLVLDCFSTNRVSELIAQLKNTVDAVIITPHWGDEYQLKPNKQQSTFARRWLEEGALAVIGTHPHVPQTWEKYVTEAGDEKLILYSSGNFVSNQTPYTKQTGLMLFLGLSKNQGKVWINGVRYLPLFMNRKPYSVVASNGIQKPTDEQTSSLQLIEKMYGLDRMLAPGESAVTNESCSINRSHRHD